MPKCKIRINVILWKCGLSIIHVTYVYQLEQNDRHENKTLN